MNHCLQDLWANVTYLTVKNKCQVCPRGCMARWKAGKKMTTKHHWATWASFFTETKSFLLRYHPDFTQDTGAFGSTAARNVSHHPRFVRARWRAIVTLARPAWCRQLFTRWLGLMRHLIFLFIWPWSFQPFVCMQAWGRYNCNWASFSLVSWRNGIHSRYSIHEITTADSVWLPRSDEIGLSQSSMAA